MEKLSSVILEEKKFIDLTDVICDLHLVAFCQGGGQTNRHINQHCHLQPNQHIGGFGENDEKSYLFHVVYIFVISLFCFFSSSSSTCISKYYKVYNKQYM